MRGQMKTNGASIKNWPLTVGRTLISSKHSSNSRSDQRALALKGRKDQDVNGLILRRFPRFFFANKDLR